MKPLSSIQHPDTLSLPPHSLGALLTGTGRFNYAAAQACGLMRDAAMAHFRRALELDPAHEQAYAALAFCEAEARDEALWAERVAVLKEEMAGVLEDGGLTAAAEAEAEAEAAAEQSEGAAPSKSMALQEATHEEGEQVAAASTADASPMQLLRTILSRQFGGVLTLLRRLAHAATTLLSRFRGRQGAGAEGGAEEEDYGKWINGQRVRTVPRVRIHSGAELMRFVREHQPVVITNFEEGYAPPEAWTREALKVKFGHMGVRVSLSQTGRFDGPEDGTLWCVRMGGQRVRWRVSVCGC